jgi:hypothetical protein
MVKSKSKSKSNSGRKLQQGGPAGSVDINYGWSTNNLLYTWQYKLDSTGSTEVRFQIHLINIRLPGAVAFCCVRIVMPISVPSQQKQQAC